jgi:sugar porter (SP) family MFS transporter
MNAQIIDRSATPRVVQSTTAAHHQGGLNLTIVASIAALGGLLFGYDTGVISGAELFLTKAFQLNSTTEELAVSAVLIGAIIGALLAGRLADALGRKRTLILLATVFAIGAILTSMAPSLRWFLAWRILVGIGVGGASVAAPMYTTELAPPARRGTMVFLFQLALTSGIAIAYWVDLWFANSGWGWRPMFGVAIIPAGMLAAGMLALPDTPRWLASKGRWAAAEAVMNRAAGSAAAVEMEEIRASLERDTHTAAREILAPGLRRALLVGVGLAILQQLVGINTIIYYAPTIFGYAGVTSANAAITATSIVGVLNVLATIVALFLVHRVGRRPLLLWGMVGMALSLVATGALFAIGPTHASTILLLCLLLYVVSFAIGMGPVFWLLSQELFPTRLRGLGSSISAMGNWGANLAVSITFLTLVGAVGRPVTFWIYAVFAMVAFVFSWRMVPETTGRSLEQIETYWTHGRRWSTPGSAETIDRRRPSRSA